MRVPPGVSAADFAEAIQQFEAAIGKDWVFTSNEDVDLYRDAYSPLWHEAEEPIPSAALAPDGVERCLAENHAQSAGVAQKLQSVLLGYRPANGWRAIGRSAGN